MAEILKKECKLEDLRKFRYGFSALKYERSEYKFEYKRDVIGDMFYVQTIYNKDKDRTYVVLDDIGFLAMFGPSESDDVIVLRFDGKVDDDKLKSLWENEPIYKAAIEGLYFKYHERIKKDEEEESA